MRFSGSILAAVAALAPAAAHAAMTYVPDTGTVARSRGGAFTAAADDPMAIVYNPAGFADQQKMQVYVDVTALQLDSTFERAPDAGGSYEKVTNKGATKVSPNLIFSQPVNDKLVWHAGAYGAVGVNMKYPEDGPQRYTTTVLTPQQLSYTAGVSYRFNPVVAVGLTLGGMYITNETEVVVSGVTETDPPSEDPANDVYAVLDVANPFTPIGVLGVKVTPVAGWEIGLSYRPPVKAALEGTYKATFVSSGGPAANEDVTLTVPLPQIIRTGVRHVRQSWDAELDFVVEDWTTRDKDVIDPKDGQIGAFSRIEIDREGKPAFSVRLGGTYKVRDNVAVHAGLLHETAGIPEERISVNVFDAPKTGVALGGSFGFASRFTLSANLTYLMLQTVEMKDSVVRQRSPFTQNPDALNVVGNGTYSGAYVMTGLALETKF